MRCRRMMFPASIGIKGNELAAPRTGGNFPVFTPKSRANYRFCA
jgi:hypothetical protein